MVPSRFFSSSKSSAGYRHARKDVGFFELTIFDGGSKPPMNIIASCLELIESWGMQVKSKTCFGSLGLATMNALCALPSDSIAQTSGHTVDGLEFKINLHYS